MLEDSLECEGFAQSFQTLEDDICLDFSRNFSIFCVLLFVMVVAVITRSYISCTTNINHNELNYDQNVEQNQPLLQIQLQQEPGNDARVQNRNIEGAQIAVEAEDDKHKHAVEPRIERISLEEFVPRSSHASAQNYQLNDVCENGDLNVEGKPAPFEVVHNAFDEL